MVGEEASLLSSLPLPQKAVLPDQVDMVRPPPGSCYDLKKCQGKSSVQQLNVVAPRFRHFESFCF